MNSTRSITFLWTPGSLVVSVLAVLIAAGFCWAAWRRSGYRPSFGMLEVLRLTIVALAAVMFNQPEWVEEFRPDEKPSIAVLWDDSTSMETRDVSPSASPGTPNSTLMTRKEAIAGMIEPSAWSKPPTCFLFRYCGMPIK